MKIILFPLLTLVFLSCASKSSESSNNNEDLVYDLKDGYAAFIKDTTQHKDSLAAVQAVYLARTYGDDGITEHATGIKKWLMVRGLNYDSIHKQALVDLKRQDTLQKNAEEYLLHNGLEGNTDDAYEKIHLAFEGMPEVERVKPLLDAVMKRYNITINNSNVLKCANVLMVMKKASKVGVTEMEVLKHIYQKGTSTIDYPTQAAMSATYLEQSK